LLEVAADRLSAAEVTTIASAVQLKQVEPEVQFRFLPVFQEEHVEGSNGN
jgi:hypothetical protein